MLDSVQDLRRAATEVAAQDPVRCDPAERAAAISALREVQDVLSGAEAGLLNAFDAHADYHEHGAPTTAAWARRELKMDGDEARKRVTAARSLTQLPVMAEAARAGRIRFEHTTALTAGIKSCGLDVMEAAQDWLLPVAQTCQPGELRKLIAQLSEVVHPERLEKAWERGMDKHDVQLAPTVEGFHLTGFLDVLTGARFQKWLEAASVPRNADDERTASQRRCDALCELFESVLAHGMPTDRGVRPQLNVLCDLETLEAVLAGHADTDGPGAARPDTEREEAYAARTAELTGFGPIGADLLSYLTCLADYTTVLTGGDTSGATPQPHVLDVARTRRLATPRQRRAVLVRQDGTCANPGCSHTHLEVHHVRWWSAGGRTDLANLVGLCRRCHILIHQGHLVVEPDGCGGFTFARPTGRGLPDHRRSTSRAVRRRLRRMLHAGPAPAPQTRSDGSSQPSGQPSPAPPVPGPPSPGPPVRTGPAPVRLRHFSVAEAALAHQIRHHAATRPRPHPHPRT